MAEEIMSAISGEVFGVWFLIGAALVFWMQAGFAMVETGFTRAKNAGNILMKNLMDFCIGTVVFILIGFSLLLGEDIVGLIGKPGFDIFTSYANFDWSNFVFNLVFCATTATIVSGAMAERTKFLSYCIYSGVISALIYPVEAHWIWGGGWLSQLGFHDFAGSCAIHMVGGISALIGAKILGPRMGKFGRDKSGKITQVNAFPGHNLPLGALGVFILWLGWYGFNGAAATSLEQLGSIFVTTTIAPAVATVTCMIFTWVKYGKPDVSMCLNASLAGLVAITAPCDVTDALGSIVIGAVAGVLVVFGVWALDYKLRIDDPVGAISVHGVCGAMGTILTGLFSTSEGLFYGFGPHFLLIQCLGVLSTAVWAAVMITIVFLILKHTIGLRVSAEEELKGLDITEHGLPSAYGGFAFVYDDTPADLAVPEGGVPVQEAVPVELVTPVEAPAAASSGGVKMTKIEILCKMERFDALKRAMFDIGITGMTAINVMGCGEQRGKTEGYFRGARVEATMLPSIQVSIVVCKLPVSLVVNTAKKVLYTGHYGDGKIFVYNVENVIKVRTGEQGYDALQDDVI